MEVSARDSERRREKEIDFPFRWEETESETELLRRSYSSQHFFAMRDSHRIAQYRRDVSAYNSI